MRTLSGLMFKRVLNLHFLNLLPYLNYQIILPLYNSQCYLYNKLNHLNMYYTPIWQSLFHYYLAIIVYGLLKTETLISIMNDIYPSIIYSDFLLLIVWYDANINRKNLNNQVWCRRKYSRRTNTSIVKLLIIKQSKI